MSSNANALASSSKHRSKHHKKDKDHEKSGSKHKSKTDKHASKSAKHHGKDKSHRDKSGPFELRTLSLRLSIPPKYAGDMLVGVKETLDGMVMRYVGQMGGVLLAHWGHALDDDTVAIINDCPYGVCNVEFQSIVWAPKLGQKLKGTHSLSSPSHLSLLFSKTFNVSIPLQHIPLDIYGFDESVGNGRPNEQSEDGSDSENDDEGGVHEVGRWRNKKTGELLGADGKSISFTVIGMQVSNQMLSITGSLLSDPTNPPPTASPTLPQIPLESSPSHSPQPPSPPTRYQKTIKTNGLGPHPSSAAGKYDTSLQPIPAPPAAAVDEKEEEPYVDEAFLNPRQLKQRRKEQEKAKKEARKARKEQADTLGLVQAVGGGDMVDVRVKPVEIPIPGQALAGKRKAADDGSERYKKKKGGR